MHKTRHLKHPNRLTTEGGFRLIRHFSPAHNRRRLNAYAVAVWKTPDMKRFKRRLMLWRRFKSSMLQAYPIENQRTGDV